MAQILRLTSLMVGFAFLQRITRVNATVSVHTSQFSADLPSMPAIFGTPWQNGVDYFAHLQFLPEHIFLCSNEESMYSLSPSDLENDGERRRHRRQLSHGINDDTTKIIHPTDDDLPVALLVSRGGCSFEEKARNAMKLQNVKYVIVFDDRVKPTQFPNLVPMSATDTDHVDMGMIFVSYTSGMQLISMVHDQFQNVTQAGGLLIKMDSIAPNEPYGPSERQQWILAAMAGFFTFLACFACLLMCVHAGIIPSDASPVAFARITPIGTILLSEEQVTALPLQEYTDNTSDSGNLQASCAVCLDEYENREKLRKLSCGHCFHHDCIMPWLTERSASCPLCKCEVPVCVPVSTDEDTSVVERNPWWWRCPNGTTYTYTSILPSLWVQSDNYPFLPHESDIENNNTEATLQEGLQEGSDMLHMSPEAQQTQ